MAAVVLVSVAAIRWRSFDGLLDWSRSNTAFNLNGVVALVLVVPVVTVFFARRRYADSLAMRGELVRLSLHDPLTGLPNRILLGDWLAQDIAASQRRNSQAAVLFVDLDKFKHVNDTHGHEVGDRLDAGRRRPHPDPDRQRGTSDPLRR
ncbi:MAG: diguanylate cyclase domain-containing protein [Acidimicrobiales bacterium]